MPRSRLWCGDGPQRIELEDRMLGYGEAIGGEPGLNESRVEIPHLEGGQGIGRGRVGVLYILFNTNDPIQFNTNDPIHFIPIPPPH
jgi:hypothetical protein